MCCHAPINEMSVVWPGEKLSELPAPSTRLRLVTPTHTHTHTVTLQRCCRPAGPSSDRQLVCHRAVHPCSCNTTWRACCPGGSPPGGGGAQPPWPARLRCILHRACSGCAGQPTAPSPGANHCSAGGAAFAWGRAGADVMSTQVVGAAYSRAHGPCTRGRKVTETGSTPSSRGQCQASAAAPRAGSAAAPQNQPPPHAGRETREESGGGGLAGEPPAHTTLQNQLRKPPSLESLTRGRGCCQGRPAQAWARGWLRRRGGVCCCCCCCCCGGGRCGAEGGRAAHAPPQPPALSAAAPA